MQRILMMKSRWVSLQSKLKSFTRTRILLRCKLSFENLQPPSLKYGRNRGRPEPTTSYQQPTTNQQFSSGTGSNSTMKFSGLVPVAPGVVGKTSNISALFSQKRYQSGKFNGWTGTGTGTKLLVCCWLLVAGCWFRSTPSQTWEFSCRVRPIIG